MTADRPLRVATYNVHRALGTDGRYDPSRIASVLDEVRADVIALQEVGTPPARPGADQFEVFRARHDGEAVMAPTLAAGEARYGNLLLSRCPIVDARVHDLSVRGCEPRNVIDATVDTGAGRLRILATHLGLRRHERQAQALRLRTLLERDRGLPTVMLGDFNEWRRSSRVLAGLGMDGLRRRPVASYPARMPLLALDRILWRPPALVRRVQAVRSDVARVASDHLPVFGEVGRS